jgi:1,4-alpha-glucan branching enzyme
MPKKKGAQNNGDSEIQTGPATVEVTFTFERDDAREVYLCGDFNHWSRKSLPMIRRDGRGVWEKRLALPPGRYEFKYIVDGVWTLDPNADENVANCFGSANSVVVARLGEGAANVRQTGPRYERPVQAHIE